MIKLLDAAKQINIDNMKLINDIQITLEERLDWLSDREPESCGVVYDAWSDKVDDLQEIIDTIEEFKDTNNRDKQSELIDEIQNNISMYQLMHGGLSRLKVY